MSQTRVFVTYVPDRRISRRAAARGQVLGRTPGVAVLAGALLAGGSAHSVAVADGFGSASPASSAEKPPAPPAQAGMPAKAQALPLLALAAADAKPPAAPAAPRPGPATETATATATATVAVFQPKPAPPEPIAAPRRDLAGFLAEQGHVLAPLSEELVAAGEPPDAAPAPIQADALAPPVQLAALLPPAAEGAGGGAPAAAVAQTYPIVSVNGAALGAVTMRGDTVHLGALLGLLQLRMPAEEFARLKAAPAADSFVSLAMLREAGLTVTIDAAGERLTLAAL